MGSKTVAIIGQGYVGLPLAIAATLSGWNVIGIDVNGKTVTNLNLGQSHIEDISDLELQKFFQQTFIRQVLISMM